MTVQKVVDSVKTTIDKNSYLIIFQDGTNIAFSYNWSQFENKETKWSNWNDLIQPMINRRGISVVYFKNEDAEKTGTNKIGVEWVNMSQLLTDFPDAANDIISAANDPVKAKRYEVKIVDIPETEFTDENNYVWTINARDGNDLNKLIQWKYHATEYYTIICDFIDLGDRSNDKTRPHLCDDIRVTVETTDPSEHPVDLDDIFVSLNGQFVNVKPKKVPDNETDEEKEIRLNEEKKKNIFYIRQGRDLLTTEGYTGISTEIWTNSDNRNELAPSELTELTENGEPKRTLPPSNKYPLDKSELAYFHKIKLAIFKWKYLNISPWMNPIGATHNTITDTVYKAKVDTSEKDVVDELTFVTQLTFPEAIEDAHMIIKNGTILKEGVDYTVDRNIPGQITLKDQTTKMQLLLAEYKRKKIDRPLHYMEQYTDSIQYYLINFSYKNDDNKANPPIIDKVNINYNRALRKNQPYKNYVIFSDFDFSDVPLIDGTFSQYLYESRNLIQYPETTAYINYPRDDQGNAYNVLDNARVEALSFSRA